MRYFRIIFYLVLIFVFPTNVFSQVGIGNTNPDTSSILDITSTTQGVLTPRMTTVQRVAISSPAEGLLVFDIDEDAFYYYDGSSSWVKLEGAIKRDNYVLVKSEADLPAPSGGIITLDENTFYEINGTITLTNSININGAYIAGLDTNEDILVRVGGTMFVGSKGGSMRNLTITVPGGTVFNLDDTVHDQTLVLQDNIIANSASVGTIKGFMVVFSNVVQYSGNSAGIVYEDINDLLLSNQGWFANNSGSYETFVGTFELIEKVSGFSTVNIGNYGIDVSSNPTVTSGILLGTAFTGTSTVFVNKYTAGVIKYNFNNNWFINSPGLSLESDWVATGDLYITTPVATPFAAANTPIKISGTTTTVNLFRFTSAVNNRLVYSGTKSRFFTCTGSISVTAATSNKTFNFYIAKNGVILPESKQSRKISNGADVGALSITATVSLDTNDYVELWVENTTDATAITAEAMNLAIR